MLYPVKVAAKHLGLSVQSVYQLCAAGKLRHSRVGMGRGKIVIPEEAIAEYLKEGERGAATATPVVAAKSRKIILENLRLPS